MINVSLIAVQIYTLFSNTNKIILNTNKKNITFSPLSTSVTGYRE